MWLAKRLNRDRQVTVSAYDMPNNVAIIYMHMLFSPYDVDLGVNNIAMFKISLKCNPAFG